jgi:CRISPR-associated endonuclease/helicase Cas3
MLGGHHGTFNQVDRYEIHRRSMLGFNHPQLGDGMWANTRAKIGAIMSQTLGVPAVNPLSGIQLVIGGGLVVVSDWLASQDTFIGESACWPNWETVDWVSFLDEKIELANEVVYDAGLVSPGRRVQSFGDVFSFAARPLQESLEIHFASLPSGSGGILVAAAPMGVGKTEAALRAASHMGGEDSGLLFLLPTMATADGMFGRVVDYTKATASGVVDVGLIHSMANFNDAFLSTPTRESIHITDDDETKTVASQWLRGRQRTLLAPVAAATIDQLLAATLRSKLSFLRWFGLSGKVVVIDEAHAFDAYMNGLLETALRWLGAFGVPVIVMSATIPSRVSQGLVASQPPAPRDPK